MSTLDTHRPRKRFGQNFLTDEMILQKIMNALNLQPTDRVIEIGSGKGALTELLLAQTQHLQVVELDRDLVAWLKQQFPSLNIHSGDALHFDYAELSKNPHDLRIVGNLPYNISTPLIFTLFESIDSIKDMHFMLQKEVVDRMTSTHNDSHYGRLSVMTQYFCEAKYLFTVFPHSFYPAPKVYSAFVRLTPRERTLKATDFDLFSDVVKEAFMYRRKQLSNCLKQYIDKPTLESIGIDPHARPENLSIDDYVRISNVISLRYL